MGKKVLGLFGSKRGVYWLMFYPETDFFRELYISTLSDVLGKHLE